MSLTRSEYWLKYRWGIVMKIIREFIADLKMPLTKLEVACELVLLAFAQFPGNIIYIFPRRQPI